MQAANGEGRGHLVQVEFTKASGRESADPNIVACRHDGGAGLDHARAARAGNADVAIQVLGTSDANFGRLKCNPVIAM